MANVLAKELRQRKFINNPEEKPGQVPVAHACNPSYSGESRSKPASANNSARYYLKKTHTKGLVE
jgi:hypothetical protein